MLVIFDFDGVLYKASWPGLFEAYKLIIEATGQDWRNYFSDLRQFKEWWTSDWHQNNKALGIEYEDASWTSEVFYEIYDSYAGLFPWVSSVLDVLSRKHCLSLLTNRHRKCSMNLLGPAQEYFLTVAGAEDVAKLKPDPEGINFILTKANIDSKDVLIIGDMKEDVLAGQAAGIKTGVVKWGLGLWSELVALGPDYKFQNPTDLLML